MKTGIIRKHIFRAGILLSGIAAIALMGAPAVSSSVTAYADGATAADVEVIGGNYFLSDYDTRAEVVEAGKAVEEDLIAEGTVLLKNALMDDGSAALPLKKTEKNISLFGKNLYSRMNPIISAMRNAGFNINMELQKFYNSTGSGAPGHPGNGVVVSGLPTGEVDINAFTDTDNSIRDFNDVAIVGFYRTSGEGFDIPRTMYQINGSYKNVGDHKAPLEVTPVDGARAIDDHQLQLDKNETALLKYCSERFKKVIVILDTPTVMECGFLDDPDHYAYCENVVGALWTCGWQTDTFKAIAKILTGEVNPSGHLPDTWARDFKADPSWNNFGDNFSEDYKDESGNTVYAKGNQYANENMRGTGGNGGGGYYSNYVYYKEGIYSGYRYWETRGYTEGIDTPWTGTETDTLPHYAHTSNEAIHYYSKSVASEAKNKQIELDGKTWDNWYNAHVVYPFGYGLSYTDFEWKLKSISETLDTDGKITAVVNVKNVGEVAGKDVVQMYYNVPYITGGIEKAHMKLAAFAKTKTLDPQESEDVELEFNVQDMASYDYNDKNKNGFKGYELDAGEYNIYIGEDIHCWAREDDANTLKKTYNLAAGVKYEKDKVTENTVENQFDRISEQLLHEDRYPEDDSKNEKDMYMSRADWDATYPTLSFRLTAEQWIIDGLREYNNVVEAPFGTVYPEDKETDPWYNNEMPLMGQKYETNIMLSDLFGLKYDDPLWDKFLNQLSYAHFTEIVLRGNYKSGMDIPEFGVTMAYNEDGPWGVGIPGALSNVSLSPDIMTAASWNVELAYRRGNILANISLWGATDASTKVPGWYAPAVNVHRNPFGGRDGEYLSEDGTLAGLIASGIVQGSQDKGMFCYVKHFAINAQETNRCGLITWADEQTMREVYFKSFEIAVKVGKTLGIMSSLNRFGPRWAGGCYELLTNVLRKEWGFRGNVVTDSYATWSNADCMIRAGGSLALGFAGLNVSPKSATTINCLRNCTHDILYAHANSMALNTGETPTVPKKLRAFNAKTLAIGMIDTEYYATVADCVELNTKYYPDLTVADARFALAEHSTLPRGLTLSEDGVISGTPTIEARMAVNIEVTFGTEVKSQAFTIVIVGAGGAIIYNAVDNSLDAEIGKRFVGNVDFAYIYDPYATEEDKAKFPDINYSLPSDSRLPEGLSLTSDGTVIGLPTKECENYAFTVVASALGYRDVDCEFVISIRYELDYASFILDIAAYGVSYSANINTAKCDGKVTYSLKDENSLPKGLTLTAGGHIAGIPLEACEKTFTVIASASCALPVETDFTIRVNPKFDTATELAYGKIGEEYLGSVDTANGSFNLVYSIVGGSLPEGLYLDEDGNIYGTPCAAGTYTVIVRAADGDLYDDAVVSLFPFAK